MDQFRASWTARLAAVAALPNQAFAEPSGCAGWLVRDLVCHLVIDAHLDDVGAAAGRAAASVRPDARVATRGRR